ncbi:helix-turn-helix domain-containing protein [Streptomyces sp. NPDC058459]|uniref:helix-turn-helix domain-containing protein n=1 Tax=Streptomyces sp. NPDC058459 TaxID=3346508 RepID=UPI00365EE71C
MRQFSGPRLRTQRRRAGLSVAQLASHIGRSTWAVYHYEAGAVQPSIAVADTLADTLGVQLDALLAEESTASASTRTAVA